MKKFKKWLKEKQKKSQLTEMAVAGFGKHKGKHINDIDSGYANWLIRSIEDSGALTGSFTADDGSGKLSKEQVIQALELRSRNKTVAPTSVNEPIRATGSGFVPKQQARATKDPVASKIIQIIKESNSLLSRLANYFGSLNSIPELNQKNRSVIERQININSNVMVNAFPFVDKTQADTSILISRLKDLYKFLFRIQPKRDYKLRIAWAELHETIEMTLRDVLGDEFDDEF